MAGDYSIQAKLEEPQTVAARLEEGVGARIARGCGRQLGLAAGMNGLKELPAKVAIMLGLIVYSVTVWWAAETLMKRPLVVGKSVILALVIGWGLTLLGLVVLLIILPSQRRINDRIEGAYASGRALVNVGLTVMFTALVAELIGGILLRM